GWPWSAGCAGRVRPPRLKRARPVRAGAGRLTSCVRAGSVSRAPFELTTTALPAYVTQLDDYTWDGHSAPAPQMLLEADAREDSRIASEFSVIQEEISRRLFHPHPEEGEPLGGFSGGPVVVVGQDGEWLIEIIKE